MTNGEWKDTLEDIKALAEHGETEEIKAICECEIREIEEKERIVEDLKYIRKKIIEEDIVESLTVLDGLIDSIENPLNMKKELNESATNENV